MQPNEESFKDVTMEFVGPKLCVASRISRHFDILLDILNKEELTIFNIAKEYFKALLTNIKI